MGEEVVCKECNKWIHLRYATYLVSSYGEEDEYMCTKCVRAGIFEEYQGVPPIPTTISSLSISVAPVSIPLQVHWTDVVLAHKDKPLPERALEPCLKRVAVEDEDTTDLSILACASVEKRRRIPIRKHIPDRLYWPPKHKK